MLTLHSPNFAKELKHATDIFMDSAKCFKTEKVRKCLIILFTRNQEPGKLAPQTCQMTSMRALGSDKFAHMESDVDTSSKLIKLFTTAPREKIRLMVPQKLCVKPLMMSS